VATTAGMTGSAAAMTGTIAAGMEILTQAGVTHDQIGGTRTGNKLIDGKSHDALSKKTKLSKLVKENFMIRTIKNVTGALVVLFLMSGCQAMTGETMGQNLDDGALTTSVKTKLASDKLVTLSRVGVETNNGIVYLTGEVETGDQKSHIGSVSSQVSGVKRVVNNLQVIQR
jgi:hyperosmotically inducible protein